MIARAFVLWVLAAVLSVPLSSSAAELEGRIIGVIDGDTVDLLTSSRDLHRVRLSGIDAPEKGQPFNQVAKKILSDLVFDRQVVVEYSKRDRYGRLVGKVVVAGRDANIQLVQSGLAWHFKRYEREQSREDRSLYASAEETARGKRMGLWAERDPLPPWDYRAAKRAGHQPVRFSP